MNYYNEIKNELINNKIYNKVKDYSKNKSDLSTYYNVGKLLVEAQGGELKAEYGNMLIKEYANKLTKDLGKGYSWRNLYNMRLFYIRFKEGTILHAVHTKLYWNHYKLLLTMNSEKEILYYINITLGQNLSYRELHERIKNKEYERLDEATKNKLIINTKNLEIQDFIKHPIIIKNKYNYDIISEKILKTLIMEDITSFMKELGNGFSYIGSEYKIKIGNRYNYIDLLLFNYIYNSFVVIELKVTEIKAEYIGQIKKYMNYIDKNLKTISQDKTIGIIICKKDNEFIMEYCSDERIYKTTYELIQI